MAEREDKRPHRGAWEAFQIFISGAGSSHAGQGQRPKQSKMDQGPDKAEAQKPSQMTCTGGA